MSLVVTTSGFCFGLPKKLYVTIDGTLNRRNWVSTEGLSCAWLSVPTMDVYFQVTIMEMSGFMTYKRNFSFLFTCKIYCYFICLFSRRKVIKTFRALAEDNVWDISLQPGTDGNVFASFSVSECLVRICDVRCSSKGLPFFMKFILNC